MSPASKDDSLKSFKHEKEDDVFGVYTDKDIEAFGQLVALAEQVYTRRNNLTLFRSIALMSIICLCGVGAYFLFTMVASTNNSIREILFSLVPVMIITLVTIVGVGSTIVSLDKAIRRERRAFDEVISVTNELFSGTKSVMSPLQVAEFRVRLSRLDN